MVSFARAVWPAVGPQPKPCLDPRAGRRASSQRLSPRPVAAVSAGAIQPVLGDERGGLGPALQVQLRQDRGYVVLHGLVREEDVRRDLLVCLSLGNQEQDLLLLSGQLGELVRVRTRCDPPDTIEDLLRDGWIQEGLTPPDGLQGGDEVTRPDLLQQVAGSPGDDCPEDRLLVRI